MNIAELLGMRKTEVEQRYKDNIVACNNINCTLELSGVMIPYDSFKHHCFLYFDIVNRSGMVMALVKMENVPLHKSIQLKFFHKIQCKGYIGSVTVSGKDILISYVPEQLVKAL